MEEVLILLSIVIIILVASLRNKALDRIGHLEEELRRLTDQINRFALYIQEREAGRDKGAGPSSTPAPVKEAPAKTEEKTEPGRVDKWARPSSIPSSPATAETPNAETQNTETSPTGTRNTGSPNMETGSAEQPWRPQGPASSGDKAPPSGLIAQPTGESSSSQTGAPAQYPGGKPPAKPLSPKPAPAKPAPGFFERHPDLEKFIGENLVSKIGIAVLVLAIGFFVKYAIDNDWIGPLGRVGIGLLCGGILVGLAHWLRTNYKAFSSVLVGGGLAIFYFSTTLAYHPYLLFGQLTAFIIMMVITAFAVLLALLYDRQELAVIALVGGFLSPFLASSGSGDYSSLFIYLLILNTGLLVIAYYKAWRLLNLLAFIFTWLLFGSWLFTLTDPVSFGVYRHGMIFAGLFYVLFFAINIAHTVRVNKRFIPSDFGILLANTCVFFGMGIYLLTRMHEDNYLGLFSASMAVFNLLTSYFLFRKKKVDTHILYLLIGITLSFISLTAPIQLHGHYITLFWASESVVLYWLYQKSGMRIIARSSLIVWVAMLVSLLLDWKNVYGSLKAALPVILNKGFLTTLYASLSCYALFRLRRSAGSPGEKSTGKGAVDLSMILVGCLLLFAGGVLEIVHQFNFYYPGTRLVTLYLALYIFSWSTLIAYAGDKWRWFPDQRYSSSLLVVNLVIYIVLIADVYDIQAGLLESHKNIPHFMAHWAGAVLIALMIWRLVRKARAGILYPAISRSFIAWVLCAMTVIFLSAEMQWLLNQLFFSPSHSLPVIREIYSKAGLTILWGISSFCFMWLGMRHKFRPLRIISLCLFSVTLLKLFIFDIGDIPVAGKIAAFFCLGVLLLVVSFMYQRLKKILVEEDKEHEAASAGTGEKTTE